MLYCPVQGLCTVNENLRDIKGESAKASVDVQSWKERALCLWVTTPQVEYRARWETPGGHMISSRKNTEELVYHIRTEQSQLLGKSQIATFPFIRLLASSLHCSILSAPPTPKSKCNYFYDKTILADRLVKLLLSLPSDTPLDSHVVTF